jgi:hypothetical protein
MQINFPLFVRAKDSGEIARFNSVHELQFQVEKIDIENEEYEAWDKDGLPVDLKLQDPVWIKLEPSTEGSHNPDGLRRALLDYAKSLGVQLPDPLTVDAFETTLSQIRAEQERKMLASSSVRRFFARFKQPPPS